MQHTSFLRRYAHRYFILLMATLDIKLAERVYVSSLVLESEGNILVWEKGSVTNCANIIGPSAEETLYHDMPQKNESIKKSKNTFSTEQSRLKYRAAVRALNEIQNKEL